MVLLTSSPEIKQHFLQPRNFMKTVGLSRLPIINKDVIQKTVQTFRQIPGLFLIVFPLTAARMI